MSREQIVKLNFLVTWMVRGTVVFLGSTVLYFVTDIHNTIKQDHTKLQNHEVRLSVIENKTKNL